MTRVCFDSNVLVAAFASRGLCADALRLVLTDYHLVILQVVAEEVLRVLETKLRLDAAGLSTVEDFFERCEIIPRGDSPSPVQVRDPDDERVLADALSGGIEILVTGDDDLLSIAEQSPIRILSPRGFMTLSRGGQL